MVEPEKTSQVEKILGLADNLFRALFNTIPPELLDLDVTMPQLKIMVILYITGEPMRMSSIAANLGVTLATATGLVDRLVDRDIITRESIPDDRRVVLCRLSDVGSQMIGRVWHSVRNNLGEILGILPQSELVSLGAILENLLEKARDSYPPMTE